MNALLDRLPPWLRQALPLLSLLLALGGVIVTVTLVDDDGDGRPDRGTVTIDVGRGEVQADRDQQLEPGERHEAREGTQAPPGEQRAPGAQTGPGAVVTPDVHEDTKDERPPGVSAEEAEQAEQTPPGLDRPEPQQGGAQAYSCPRRYVRNYSSRGGARTSMLVLHFTVSAPGSLDAIRNLFNTPSFGASSTYGVELSGRCEQWVPYDGKPWTNGAFNPVTETWEIVTFNLTREQWLNAPIIRDGLLAAHVRDRARALGIPLRLVNPEGCTPIAGITDHDRLECGNLHWDVGDNFPWKVFLRQVRAGVKPISDEQRKRCRELNGLRAIARDPQRSLTDRQRKRRRAIARGQARNGLECRYPPKRGRAELVRK